MKANWQAFAAGVHGGNMSIPKSGTDSCRSVEDHTPDLPPASPYASKFDHAMEGAGIDLPGGPALVERSTAEWLGRRLHPAYAAVIFDTLPGKIRRPTAPRLIAFRFALGIHDNGEKDILGAWAEPADATSGWEEIATDLAHRGVTSIRLAMGHEFAPLRSAMARHYPRTTVAVSYGHLVRKSLAAVSLAHREEIAAVLAAIGNAGDAGTAAILINRFRAGPLGRLYPEIGQRLLSTDAPVLAAFALPAAVRKFLWTINPAEGVIRKLRQRGLRPRTWFPDAATALPLLAESLLGAPTNWRVSPKLWRRVASHLRDVADAEAARRSGPAGCRAEPTTSDQV